MEEDQSAEDRSGSTEENEWHKEGREASTLQANMNTVTVQLQVENEEGSKFLESDMIVPSHDLDLSLDEYKGDAQEVSSGEFDAIHSKRYVNPMTFRHALWYAAGPSAGAMVTCLGIFKDKLEGELAGILVEFKNQPEQLIPFLYEEAGTETNAAINYITGISARAQSTCWRGQ